MTVIGFFTAIFHLLDYYRDPDNLLRTNALSDSVTTADINSKILQRHFIDDKVPNKYSANTIQSLSVWMVHSGQERGICSRIFLRMLEWLLSPFYL